VQAAYLLTMAVLFIPMGRLADQYGRVRFYLIGTAVFTAGSLLAALSMNGAWLIGSRVVQGGGAALMVATSAAVVTAVFPPEERGRALGINVMAVYIGLSIGPPLGGILADTVGWRSIFLINLPIGLVVLVWGWMMLPRTERVEDAPRVDFAGATLLGVFLISLLVPLTFAPEWGWVAPLTLALLALAVVSLAGFVVVERRVDAPILDLDLLVHNRLFATANLAALLNYMALFAVSVLTAIFLEVVQGRSVALTGWLMLSQPLLMAILSPFSGRLSDRIGSRILATGGMVAIAVGMVLLAAMPTTASVWQVAADLAIVGLGMAAFSAPNTSAIMGSVRRDQLGLASAFIGTMRTTGQALSVAVLGGIAASQMGRLGGRLLFTHGSGGTSGLAAQAVSGFAQGYRYAMITGAVLALLGAAVSLTRGAHEAQA
jgi:EmrB/QacA subfamily drug resistance transporter